MAKDPAFLFYPNDWLGGTMGMTFEEKGAYMDLLMMQFNRGHMTSHMIGQVVGQIWDNIKHKFTKDDEGLWFNERLDIEKNKRKAYVDSRKNNKIGKNQHTKKRGHMTSHMENVNENENKDNKEGKKQKIINPELKEVVEYFRDNGYTSDSAKKAFEYYSVADWHDSKGSKVKNWKQKMRGVWFKPENKEVKKPKLFNDDDDSFIPTGKSI